MLRRGWTSNALTHLLTLIGNSHLTYSKTLTEARLLSILLIISVSGTDIDSHTHFLTIANGEPLKFRMCSAITAMRFGLSMVDVNDA